MKRILFTALSICLLVIYANAQTTFWTENFGNGTNCAADQGTVAQGFNGGNGAWSVTNISANGTSANNWFVSQTEAGFPAGSCGDGCLNNATLTNRTLHIGNIMGSPGVIGILCATGDCGAAYDAGTGNGVVVTDKRAESPVISCAGQNNITLSFDYIMEGQAGSDFLTVYYFDGAAWNVLATPGATNNVGCNPQGAWTNFTIALPASANNNPNVRIGFRWENNDDATGGPLSVAIDNIQLISNITPPTPTTLTITITPPAGVSNYCTGIGYQFTGNANPGPIALWQWYLTPPAGGVITPPIGQNGVNIQWSLGGTYTITAVVTATNGTKDSLQQVVNVTQRPVVMVGPTQPSVCIGGGGTVLTATGATSYTWTPNNFLTPLAATNDSVLCNPPPPGGISYTYTVVGNSGIAGCNSVPVNIVVNTFDKPAITTVAANDTICAQNSAIISAVNGTSTTTYAWSALPTAGLGTNSGSFVQVTPVYNGLVDTTFSYQVIPSVPGCPPYTPITQLVVVHPKPRAVIATDTVENCNNAGALLVATSLPNVSGTTYQWSPATGLNMTVNDSVVATPASATMYYVTPTSVYGCVGFTDSVRVVNGQNTNAGIVAQYNQICLGQNDTIFATPLLSAMNMSYNYFWQPPLGIVYQDPNKDTIVVSPAVTTTYTLTVTGICVQTKTVTLTVQVNNCLPPIANFYPLNFTNMQLCLNQCIWFQDTSIGAQPMHYYWSFPGGTPDTVYNDTTRKVKVCYKVNSQLANGGQFPVILHVVNGLGQSSTYIDSIKVSPGPLANAGPNFTINLGDGATLTPSTSTGNNQITSYNWAPPGSLSCTTCPNPVANPTVTTTYTLTVRDKNGCPNTDTVTVFVDKKCGEVFVPNVFSPNGDKMNDILHVKSNCIKQLDFKIFNRWGEIVFETTDENYGWDGTYKGKPMDAGVFVYQCNGWLTDGTEIKQKGSITLLR